LKLNQNIEFLAATDKVSALLKAVEVVGKRK
jgi:hypothetical protein